MVIKRKLGAVIVTPIGFIAFVVYPRFKEVFLQKNLSQKFQIQKNYNFWSLFYYIFKNNLVLANTLS